MGKYTDKIIHINATPEFLANPKCMEALEELCKRAYHYKPKNNNMKKAEKLLLEMGFKKVTQNQFSHTHFGYIHLNTGTMKEVAEKIFELGQYKKCEELFGVLKVSSFVR